MRLHSITITVAALALTATSVASGSNAPDSARTIKAVAQGTGITFIDADHSGKPSVGDYEVGSSVYLNARTGKAIGRGTVVCTQVNATGTRYQCQGQSHFAGGDVLTAGLFDATAKTYTQAVVGGTGVYASAAGTLSGAWLDARFSKARVVFTLNP
jgi:hypothetical protein